MVPAREANMATVYFNNRPGFDLEMICKWVYWTDLFCLKTYLNQQLLIIDLFNEQFNGTCETENLNNSYIMLKHAKH